MVYELTLTSAGRVYVRYLPGGVKVGAPQPDFLTVATYPVANPTAAVRRAARNPDAVSLTSPGGAIGVYNRSRPTSVYFAAPTSGEQVETYDPSAAVARKLVLSGSVKPVQ